MSALLEVDSVVRTFGGIRAVDDVSFTVQRSEVFGVIGPNGAGKTALLNCISGVYPVQSGTISFAGTRIEALRPDRIARLGVARTFQNTEYFKDFVVLDYVMLGRAKSQPSNMFRCAVGLGRVRTLERKERDFAFDLLRELGLAGFAKDHLKSLPYGVQKRIDIARALASEPSVILLDEPTSGIAIQERGLIADIIGRVRSLGITAVVVDHDVDFVTKACDRILVMNYGRVLGTGAPEEVFRRADVMKAYIGE
jgi:branched-chain amino acid transport system ATP-binding protein